MKKSVNSEPALALRRRCLPALTALAIGIGAMATACSGGDEPDAPDPEASTVTLRLNIAGRRRGLASRIRAGSVGA